MSGKLTTFGAGRALKAGVGEVCAAAASMYLCLGTALPGTPKAATLAAYGSVEVSTAGYTRQEATWETPTTDDPAVIAIAENVTFGPFEADPPNVTHVWLVDASVGSVGNVMAYWEFEVAKDQAEDDSLVISAGMLTVTAD